MKCCIVRDLLPNYIEGLTGEEAGCAIKEHLITCDGCRGIYTRMSADIAYEHLTVDKEIDFLKKARTRGRLKLLLVMVSVCLTLAGLGIFAALFPVPVPFEPNNMYVEIFPATHVTYDSGAGQRTVWKRLDYLDWEQTKAFLEHPEEYEVIEAADLVFRNMPRGSCDTRKRDIRRDGEEVMVVYFCYTESLWDHLFYNAQRQGTRGCTIQDVSLPPGNSCEGDYQPCLKEVYYLPARDMERLDKLSDEAFDALRENAALVWSGVI